MARCSSETRASAMSAATPASASARRPSARSARTMAITASG